MRKSRSLKQRYIHSGQCSCTWAAQNLRTVHMHACLCMHMYTCIFGCPCMYICIYLLLSMTVCIIALGLCVVGCSVLCIII